MNFLKKIRKRMVYIYHYIINGIINFIKCPKPIAFFREIQSNLFIENIHVVRHAGGEINQNIYTNSLEAIEKSVELRCYTIELDFVKTNDGYICFHDEKSMGFKKPSTVHELNAHKILGEYTPLSLDDVLDLLEKCSELCIVTDCKKENLIDFLETIIAKLEARNMHECYERFIIQVYSINQLKELEQHYPFFVKGLTLYLSNYYVWDFYWLTKMCALYNAPILIMPYQYIDNKNVLRNLKRKNIKVWVHTVNDDETITVLKQWGVDCIYTDILTHYL